MRQLITDEFSPLTVTTGTVQNASRLVTVEISNSTTKGSGVLLPPLKGVSFNNQTLYVRCFNGAGVEIVVVPFTLGGSGGTSGGGSSSELDGGNYRIATNEEILAMLEENFGKDWYNVASDEEIAELLENIFGEAKYRIATDKEIQDMLDANFGTEG